MKCRRCNLQMGHYLGCEPNKKPYEFWRCPKCWAESKHFIFNFDEEEFKRNEGLKQSVLRIHNDTKGRKKAHKRRQAPGCNGIR